MVPEKGLGKDSDYHEMGGMAVSLLETATGWNVIWWPGKAQLLKMYSDF